LVIHRTTGDPHPQELLAPTWCLDKPRVLRLIKEEFARRGSRQGSRWEGQRIVGKGQGPEVHL